MLAWRAPGTLTGNNLGVLWFIKNQNGTWSSWSWPAPEVGPAVCSIRAIQGNADSFADQPDLNLAAINCAGSVAPVPVEKGLLQSDPLLPVIGSATDPGALVQALTNAGWQAAPDLSEMMASSRIICQNVVEIDDILDGVQYRTLEKMDQITPADLVPCRFSFSECTGCEYTYTGVTATGPWVITSGNCINGTRRCEYKRNATATQNTTGIRTIICIRCGANGSTVTGHEYATSLVPCTQTCPATPEGEISFIPD